MAVTEQNIKMAQNLKELRLNYYDSEKEKKGLSHQRLSDLIMEKYGISISKSSLINYEAIEHHTKAGSNAGMRVDYLRCLSDLYGVSADYILGLTDIKSSDVSLQSACKYTGLSESALQMIRQYKEDAIASYEEEKIDVDRPDYKNVFLDYFLNSPHFHEIGRALFSALQAEIELENAETISQKRFDGLKQINHPNQVTDETDSEFKKELRSAIDTQLVENKCKDDCELYQFKSEKAFRQFFADLIKEFKSNDHGILEQH